MSRPRTRTALLAAVALVMLVIVPTARTEVSQNDGIRVIFKGKLTPHALPRTGLAPVRVAVGATIVPSEGTAPPPLRKISIEINRHGHFDPSVLPLCRYEEIQPSTTRTALRACGRSFVGKGFFSSTVLQPDAAPFPSEGPLYAFNGTYKGRPAILAHVYGTEPIPVSFTIPFVLSRAKGTYGTALTAQMPSVGEQGFITGLSLNLGRTLKVGKERRSYLSAGCPAPKGTGLAPFKFARASFHFGTQTINSTLVRSCRVRRG